jgi:hypothetical protein
MCVFYLLQTGIRIIFTTSVFEKLRQRKQRRALQEQFSNDTSARNIIRRLFVS